MENIKDKKIYVKIHTKGWDKMAKNKSKNINIKQILTLIIIIIIGLALEYINSNISNETNASEN